MDFIVRPTAGQAPRSCPKGRPEGIVVGIAVGVGVGVRSSIAPIRSGSCNIVAVEGRFQTDLVIAASASDVGADVLVGPGRRRRHHRRRRDRRRGQQPLVLGQPLVVAVQAVVQQGTAARGRPRPRCCRHRTIILIIGRSVMMILRLRLQHIGGAAAATASLVVLERRGRRQREEGRRGAGHRGGGGGGPRSPLL